MLWTARLESKFFTIIKNEFPQRLKKTYSMTDVNNFSTVESSTAPSNFPFVYVRELESPTVAKTLRRNTKPGIDYTLQIDVSGKTKGSAQEVAGEIEEILVKKGFDCRTFPNGIVNGIHKYVVRANRIICYGDKF